VQVRVWCRGLAKGGPPPRAADTGARVSAAVLPVMRSPCSDMLLRHAASADHDPALGHRT